MRIIASQRSKKRAYQIVFLDLAKAFDTVNHESIRKTLMRKGVPREIIGMYVNRNGMYIR